MSNLLTVVHAPFVCGEKMAYIPQAQRDSLKPSQFGDPQGRRFPIRNQQDVTDAAHLIGRASNPDAVKRRITAIARRNGWKIPEAWQTATKADPDKVHRVMHEFKHGGLHSGSAKGPKVTDRKQAIAIALSEANKDANYHAKMGETIAGNLARGEGGRFSSAGNVSASSTLTERQRQQRQALEDRQAKERDAASAKDQAKRQNVGDIAEKLLGPDAAEMLTVGDKIGDLSGVKPEYGDKLVGMGLAMKLKDGSYILNGSGRSFITQAAKGDLKRAQQVAERAQAAADKKNAPKKGKGGGGSAKAPKKTTTTGSIKDKYGADAEEALSLMAVDPSAVPNPDIAKNLLANGLIRQTAPGKYELTDRAKSEMANEQAPAPAPAPKPKKTTGGKRGGGFRFAGPGIKAQSFFVRKDALGQWRWITFTSSSYMDRDGEIVPQDALERDVARADATKEYGPLLWWHMDGQDGPRVQLGTCDYNEMVGRVLVESGTFVNDALAIKVAGLKDSLAVSMGFYHDSPVRGLGVVFKAIRRKERSLLPLGIESNYLTKLFVKEKEQMGKLDALKALFGGGREAEELVQTLVQEAATKEQDAERLGLAYKAAAAQGAPMGGDVVNAAQMPAKKPPVAEKDDMPPMEGDAATQEGLEPEAEPEGDEGSYEGSEADMVVDQTVQELYDGLGAIIAAAMQNALKPVADIIQQAASAAGSATKEANTTALALKEVAQHMTNLAGENKALKARLEKLEGSLTELMSDTPPIAHMGRASMDPRTATKDAAAGPAVDPFDNGSEDPYVAMVRRMTEGFRVSQ